MADETLPVDWRAKLVTLDGVGRAEKGRILDAALAAAEARGGERERARWERAADSLVEHHEIMPDERDLLVRVATGALVLCPAPIYTQYNPGAPTTPPRTLTDAERRVIADVIEDMEATTSWMRVRDLRDVRADAATLRGLLARDGGTA